MPVEARRRTLTLADGAVSYLEWVPEQSRGDVLLIHGGSYDSAELSWGEVGGILAEADWRVIAPDTPGFGFSPAATWRFTQERLVDHLGAVIKALELENFALGGLSMGGGMSLGYALRQQDRIRGLMLLGSYGLIDRTTEGWHSLPVHLLSWAVLKSGLVALLAKRFSRTVTPASIERAMRHIVRNPESRTPELLDSLVTETRRHTGSQDGFRQWQEDEFLLTRTRTNYVPLLHTFGKPALVVNGDRDLIIPAAAAVRAAEALLDSTLVVVPGAGHWVQRDAPELVTDAMLGFLDGLPN